MKEFTIDELAGFDGKDGRAAYVAYEGVVYDVTESAMWGDGDHEGMHFAGADLTAEHGCSARRLCHRLPRGRPSGLSHLSSYMEKRRPVVRRAALLCHRDRGRMSAPCRVRVR